MLLWLRSLFLNMTNKKYLLAAVCLVHFILGLDINIVSVSLPAISSHFNVNASEASRIVWVYFLILTAFLPGFGRLGDLIGFKKLFLSGIFIFFIAAIFNSFSDNLNLLVLSRAFQALGTAALFALTPAIIASYFDEHIKGRAFGINYIFTALGGVVGRSLSGFITNAFGWNSVFLITTPFAIAALVLSYLFVPDIKQKYSSGKFDIIGSLLIFIALLSFLFVMNSGNDYGWLSEEIISISLISVIFFITFFIRLKFASYPLLKLELFRKSSISVHLLIFMIVYIITNGMIFITPFFLQLMKGFDGKEAGLLMTIPSVFQMIFGFLSGYLSDKIYIRKILFTGFITVLVSFVMFLFSGAGMHLFFIISSLTIYGAAIGFLIPANTNTVMKFAPYEDKGSISSIMTTTVRAGSAIGVCIFSAIFSIYVPQKNPLKANLPVEILSSGFFAVFLFGIAVSLFGLILVYFTGKRKITSADS